MLPGFKFLRAKTKVVINKKELHFTHRLAYYRGFFACLRCGAIASSHPLGMYDPCPGNFSCGKCRRLKLSCWHRSQAQSRLERIMDNKLPSGMSRWPDETGARFGVTFKV